MTRPPRSRLIAAVDVFLAIVTALSPFVLVAAVAFVIAHVMLLLGP